MLMLSRSPILSVKTEFMEIDIPREISGEAFDLTFEDSTPEPPAFDPRRYQQLPDPYAVLEHETYNLPALGIVINTLLCCVICIECGEGIEPTNIHAHARQHNPHHTAAEAIGDDLTTEFGLVTMERVPYPLYPIPPLFGLPIDPDMLHFCTACHRGFHGVSGLRSHQSSPGRCDARGRGFYVGHGQMLTNGKHRRYFPVNVSGLKPPPSPSVDYSLVFEQTLPPPVDYSKAPIRNVEDQQNLNTFLFREGWLDAVNGFSPEDILEAVRMPNDDDGLWARALQKAAHRSLEYVQCLISEHHGFGLTEAIAQFYPMCVLVRSVLGLCLCL